MSRTKTEQAFLELQELLKRITADEQLTLEEVAELMTWRVKWSTVVKRPALRPFTEWLDGAVADSKITTKEAQELMRWADEINEHPEREIIAPAKLVPLVEKWRGEPATERQMGFLVQLGMPENEVLKLTKGEASNRIDQLLEAKRAREQSGGGGCLTMLMISLALSSIGLATPAAAADCNTKRDMPIEQQAAEQARQETARRQDAAKAAQLKALNMEAEIATRSLNAIDAQLAAKPGTLPDHNRRQLEEQKAGLLRKIDQIRRQMAAFQ